MSKSEIQLRADFSTVRYAQCWEDSRLLTQALEPKGKRCLSIGSAGDNSFALLAAGAEMVTAVEMNPAQIACIELRQAAYLALNHLEFLELIGSRASSKRPDRYAVCRALLSPPTQAFWDSRPHAIAHGIGSYGKFEHYFSLFRSHVLPIAHSRKKTISLLNKRTTAERLRFYEEVWNNRRWRWIFRIFFSRTVMGALGRDPEFFKYVEGSVAARILERTRHALTVLDPSENPYLHWILTGTHGEALPDALAEKNFLIIRELLQKNRLEIVNSSLEEFLGTHPDRTYDAFNLSDIFEYMSEESSSSLIGKIAGASRPGARLAYWNMLAPRSRPQSMAHRLISHTETADALLQTDRAFFYSRFILEEVIA